MNEPVFLALGTNLGDRESNLSRARELLSQRMKIIDASPIYITPPWGFEEQPDFLNQILQVQTEIAPRPLLRYLKKIESKMGRVKTFRNGPRLIDIDILFYGQRVIKSSKLSIPHPRLHERAFVLVPLNGLAPDFVHPVLNITVETMLSEIDVKGVRPL